MLGIAQLLSDAGLEYFQLAMMLVASGLIVQMVFWMRRHGRTFKRDLEADMQSNAEAANWWGLLVVVALAVGRESAETVGLPVRSRRPVHERAGASCTVLALGHRRRVRSRSGRCSRAARYFSWRTFFRVSEILLLLLAGALLVSAVDKLIALDVLPALVDPLVGHVGADRRFEPRRRACSARSPAIARAPRCCRCIAACRVLGGGRRAVAPSVRGEPAP